MSESTQISYSLSCDPETGELKRCCNMEGEPLKQCCCSNGGGNVELGMLTVVPEYGAGRGTYRKVVVTEQGDFIATGDEIPVIIPRIYHNKG